MRPKGVEIGIVGIDSGTLLLGDPSYWLSKKDYDKELLRSNFDRFRQCEYDSARKGKGVIVSSGYGDGVYPVYAVMQDGWVKEVTVEFF